jgi:hypothetical protein
VLSHDDVRHVIQHGMKRSILGRCDVHPRQQLR